MKYVPIYNNTYSIVTSENPHVSHQFCAPNVCTFYVYFIFVHEMSTLFLSFLFLCTKCSTLFLCTKCLHFLYLLKIKIYHGLIHSHLSYCPLIWLYEQPMKNLKILEVLQKKAIRAIFCTKSNSHTTNLFSLSKIITVRNLCANDQLKIMYQFKEKLLPSAISNIIEPTLAITKNSRAKTNAHHRTTKNTGNFAFDMIHQWNKFDSPIKNKRSSLPTVKNSIKSYLQKLTESKCNKPDCHACLRTPPIKKLYDYMNPNNKL